MLNVSSMARSCSSGLGMIPCCPRTVDPKAGFDVTLDLDFADIRTELIHRRSIPASSCFVSAGRDKLHVLDMFRKSAERSSGREPLDGHLWIVEENPTFVLDRLEAQNFPPP